MELEKTIRKVDRAEVKINYILAQGFKSTHGMLNYDAYHEKLREMDEDGLNSFFDGKNRLKRIDSLTWFRGYKDFEDVGSWPGMQFIPENFTLGNLVETSDLVEESVRNGNGSISIKLIEKIVSIQDNLDYIGERFLPILVPGGLIRSNHQGNLQDFRNFDYDIEDGNTRMLAYALKGIRQTEVYFGEAN